MKDFTQIEAQNQSTEIFRQLFDLVHVKFQAVLEIQENLTELLDEIQTWLIRADDIFNESGGISRLPPELTPRALLAARLEAEKDRESRAKRPARRPRRSAEESVLERAALSGVTEFALNWNPNGSAVAVVQGIEIALTVTLSKLLSLLADPEIGKHPEGAQAIERDLCPFKSDEELSTRLGKLLGRPFTAKTIQNLLSRLRSRFVEAGANQFFIQRSAEGLRLALHRKAWPARVEARQ